MLSKKELEKQLQEKKNKIANGILLEDLEEILKEIEELENLLEKFSEDVE